MLQIDIAVPLSEAIEIVGEGLVVHQFHTVGKCDVKSMLKALLDKDIEAVTWISVIHAPTSYAFWQADKPHLSALLFPITLSLSSIEQGRRSRLRVLDPRTKASRGDETLEAAARHLRTVLKSALKHMNQEADLINLGTGPAT